MSNVNTKIIPHLSASPSGIIFGNMQPVKASTSTLLAAPSRSILKQVRTLLNPPSYRIALQQYHTHRAQMLNVIATRSKKKKDKQAERYDRGVKQVVFKPGNLVMLYQDKIGKLQASWRGPF